MAQFQYARANKEDTYRLLRTLNSVGQRAHVSDQVLQRVFIASLVDITREFDCAVLVLAPDDMVMKRDATPAAPRDNIIFEAGLFRGTLGRARTFLVYSRDERIVLPSGLAGATPATYAMRSGGNLHAALGPVCTRINRALGLP